MLASISRTKNGGYAVRWRDASGRQRWRTVPGPRRNAEKVRADLENRMALGHLYEAPPETLGAFLAGWLERYKLRVRPSTHARRCQALKALGVLSEREGGQPSYRRPRANGDSQPSAASRSESLSSESLRSLSVAEVEDAVAELAARAPRQAQMALAALKDALRDARKRGQRFDEHILEIDPPRYQEKTARFLTWEQVEELASWMPESLKRIVPVAALTGLRQGELFSLKEDDLDLEAGTLAVRHGKTAAATRIVDIPSTAMALLREQLIARRHTADRLVFPAPQGGRLRRDNFNARFFRPATRHAKLEGVTTHSLRHTYVSLAAMAGVRVEVIAQQIGHVDGGALLLRRYRHLFAGETKDAATKLEALIRPQEKKAREESA